MLKSFNHLEGFLTLVEKGEIILVPDDEKKGGKEGEKPFFHKVNVKLEEYLLLRSPLKKNLDNIDSSVKVDILKQISEYIDKDKYNIHIHHKDFSITVNEHSDIETECIFFYSKISQDISLKYKVDDKWYNFETFDLQNTIKITRIKDGVRKCINACRKKKDDIFVKKEAVRLIESVKNNAIDFQEKIDKVEFESNHWDLNRKFIEDPTFSLKFGGLSEQEVKVIYEMVRGLLCPVLTT